MKGKLQGWALLFILNIVGIYGGSACAEVYPPGLFAQKTHSGNEPATQNATTPDAVQSNATKTEASPSGTTNDGVHRLDTVEVEGQRKESGTASISGKELHSLPSHSGSITEALKGMPNVQFSNEEISSRTGGEIRPPRISIAGAKPYENNFLIDGLSVTNTLNPNGLNGDEGSASYNDMTVNGADQTIFYDTSLVDSITVHTSNVPAKYGSFVGGVVDAKLIDPRKDRWHGVFTGRHTRSKWDNLRGVDINSEEADNQARFNITSMSATLDGPVTDNASLLLSVSQKKSIIPLLLEENDGTKHDKDQWRISENYFAKMTFTPSEDFKFSLDSTYAPYSEKRWREQWPDSDWKTENKAWRFGSSAELTTDAGLFSGKLAYSQNGFSRDASNSYRYSHGDEAYGAVGDATVQNRSIDLGLDYDAVALHTGDVEWRFSTGLDVNNTTTDMWNEQARAVTLVDQTLNRWILTDVTYPERNQSKTLNTLGYYGQAEIEFYRLTLTPGFRIDYDDFTYNTDIAPRFKAELDTFGNGMLRLVGGVNRYYGSQLRAYAFDRYRTSYIHQERDTNGDGIADIVTDKLGADRNYQAKGLETPYSDELTGGVLGDINGYEYGIELVHRDHKNQLISVTRGDNLYELTNDGKSTYDGITLSLARSFQLEDFGSHRLALGFTQSKTKTFNGAFNSDINTIATSGGYAYGFEQVYYNGELVDRSELPAEDYNAPLVITLSWQGNFYEDRLRLNSVTRWRDSATGLYKDARVASDTPYGTTSSNPNKESSNWLDDSGEYHDAYRKGVIPGGMITDLSLEFDALREEAYTVTLLLDVLNVFDGTVGVGVAEEDINKNTAAARGRSFYAGIRCEF